MKNDTTCKGVSFMTKQELLQPNDRTRLRWAAPAALALALGWPLGAAADCDSGTGCLTTALDGLVGGFTGSAGSQLWGWMLGGSQSAGTGEIAAELDNIQNTLATIENELGPNSAIVKQLQQVQCAGDSDWIAAGAATTITSWYAYYQNFLTDLKVGSTLRLGEISKTSNTDVTTLYGWANGVIQGNANAGLTAMLPAINSLWSLTTSSTSAGTVFDCVKANMPMPAAGSLDDRPAYAVASNMQNYLLNLNTQAMIILTEAYHIYAYGECITSNGGDSANIPAACQSDSADDIIPNLCPTGNVSQYCIEPITIYGSTSSGQFLQYVYDEFAEAGAPLSTDDHLMVNGEGHMLVRSIERYNAAAGDNCPDPQVEPNCGRTVGKWNFKGPLATTPVGPYGYGGGGTEGTWQVADESLFNALLNQGFNQTQTEPIDGTVTPGEFLCTMSMTPDPSACTQANGGAGLENADKLVLFPESLRYYVIGNGLFIGPLACFMDGYMERALSLQPFCAQQEFDQVISRGRVCGGDVGAQTGTQPGVAPSSIPYYPDWYDILVCQTFTSPTNWYTDWKTFPGYIGSDNASLNPPAFWWPALPLDSITCDNGGSPLDAANLNPAGVPKLCREKDFRIWFETIVPPGPTTTTAIADTNLDAAAPNSNGGGGPELKLAGLQHSDSSVALLGFDPAQLQAFLQAGPLDNARLILTRVDTSTGGSGPSSKGRGKQDKKSLLVLRPLSAGFVEGNGNLAGTDRGAGSGSTWNCAEDAEIANDEGECLQYWSRGGGWESEWGTSNAGRGGESNLFVEEGQGGLVSWDVTEAVRNGVHAWALQLRGSDSLAFYSREGAAAEGDPGLAPTLILTHPVETSVSLNE